MQHRILARKGVVKIPFFPSKSVDLPTNSLEPRRFLFLQIFAVEIQWNGEVVGSCGPLAENDLKDLNSYEYTSDKNEWLQEVNAKLLLME